MKAVLKLGAVGVGLVCLVGAMVPWRIVGANRSAEIASHIAQATGLAVQARGPITLKLLPRPRVQITDVSVRDASGALSADAPAVYGDLDLQALINNHWRLVSATLAEPTITLDSDKVPPSAFLGAQESHPPLDAAFPVRLSVRSGVIRVQSRDPGSDTLVTDVNVTAEQGGDLDGRLALSGSAVWHGALGQFTARITHPKSALDGGSSSAFLQLTSALQSFSAVGDVSGGPQPQFSGRVTASTNALPRLFGALGLPSPWLNVERASVTADAVAKMGELSLSGTTLKLEDTSLEGTLGLHSDGNRTLIEGTLATDYLDISRLADHALDAQSAEALFRRDITADLLRTDVDLRLSASVAHWGNVDVQDAAISALSHDGRAELTLDEAGAFNGTIKARAVASVGKDGLEAHAEASASSVDLGPLTSALLGQERATGALTGRLGVEGQGRSLSDIVHSSAGDGQVTVQSGNFVGISVAQAMKRFTRKLPWSEDKAAQITTFDTASTAIRVAGGVVEFVDGRVTGPGIQLSFGGHSDLPQGQIRITALATQTDAAGSPVAGGARLPFEMRGNWGERLMFVEHGRGLTLPGLPLVGSGEVLP